MFGNSHRLYFMVWVTAVTIYYFDRGLLVRWVLLFCCGALLLCSR